MLYYLKGIINIFINCLKFKYRMDHFKNNYQYIINSNLNKKHNYYFV